MEQRVAELERRVRQLEPKDAERFKELRTRFQNTKTSEAERILYDLDLETFGEPHEELGTIVDRAIAQR